MLVADRTLIEVVISNVLVLKSIGRTTDVWPLGRLQISRTRRISVPLVPKSLFSYAPRAEARVHAEPSLAKIHFSYIHT